MDSPHLALVRLDTENTPQLGRLVIGPALPPRLALTYRRPVPSGVRVQVGLRTEEKRRVQRPAAKSDRPSTASMEIQAPRPGQPRDVCLRGIRLVFESTTGCGRLAHYSSCDRYPTSPAIAKRPSHEISLHSRGTFGIHFSLSTTCSSGDSSRAVECHRSAAAIHELG